MGDRGARGLSFPFLEGAGPGEGGPCAWGPVLGGGWGPRLTPDMTGRVLTPGD